MIETPHIVRTEAVLTAVLPLVVPRAHIGTVMGPGIAELMRTVKAQGIAVTGAWFTHHLRRPGENFDFEICLPVAARVEAAGRVGPGLLPAATVARTVHRGDYSGLGAAWGELMAWIEARGHERAGDLWERYLAGPEADADPATWRTELNQPLVAVSGEATRLG